MYNQGFVIYETILTKRHYFFEGVIHDYGMVFLDNVHIINLDRSVNSMSKFNVNCVKDNCTLRIIV